MGCFSSAGGGLDRPEVFQIRSSPETTVRRVHSPSEEGVDGDDDDDDDETFEDDIDLLNEKVRGAQPLFILT